MLIKKQAFDFAQSVKRKRKEYVLFSEGCLKLLPIASSIYKFLKTYPSTNKLSTTLARYKINLARAGPPKFRLVSFLLIKCVPNTDKETMGQGARTTKCGQR